VAINFTPASSNDNILKVICAILLLVSLLLWFFGAFKKIDSDEIGAVSEFGKIIYDAGPGLWFVPLPSELRKEKRLNRELQIPDGNDTSVQILHGCSLTPTGDPLDNRLTTSIRLMCRYKINSLSKFIENIGSDELFKRQVKDLLISKIQIECNKYSLAINLTRIDELNHILLVSVQNMSNTWGVEIINAQIVSIDLGNAINDAQMNASVSAINTTVHKNNAQKIYYEGLASAEVSKAFQYAKAQGLKKISEELGIDETLTIYQIDTLSNVWKKSNTDVNLYGGNLTELFGLIISAYKADSNKTKDLG